MASLTRRLRHRSISRPDESKPSARGAPGNPVSSRYRSKACTVGVHGDARLWITPSISTAPVVLPPGSGTSAIPLVYRLPASGDTD